MTTISSTANVLRNKWYICKRCARVISFPLDDRYFAAQKAPVFFFYLERPTVHGGFEI